MAKNNNSSILFNTPSRIDGSYCEVIIPLALPTTYTWAVPQHLQAAIKIQTLIRMFLAMVHKEKVRVMMKIKIQKLEKMKKGKKTVFPTILVMKKYG